MPKATVTLQSIERHDLKTAPPDGYVVLRRLTYGQLLERRGMSASISLDGNAKTNDIRAEIGMAQKAVADYEFTHCIVEHNLTDENDVPLDFQHGVPLLLDPRIGDEIGQLIDNMNQYDEGNS
jgi:hypothetical protein